MKGQIISDWSKVNFGNPNHRAKVFGALQAFMLAPLANTEKISKQIQAIAQQGDFPAIINQIIEKFHAVPYYDTGFEDLFDIRDFTGTNEAGFDILTVEDGLAFSKVPVGGKAEIYKMGGARVSVNFDLYGAGLGWFRTLIDDLRYWTLEDNAIAFRNRAYHDKAAAFYALIEAISSTKDISWAASPDGISSGTATYLATRDAATFSSAAMNILKDIKDAGYGITPQNAIFTILCPIDMTQRVQNALNLMLQPFALSQLATSAYKFKILPTMLLTQSTTDSYVILPKIRMKGGNRMNLTIFNRFDEESYSDVAVGWMRFAGAIGDTRQLRRVKLA